MATTRITPQQLTVGPLPEVEPPPMVAGGQVWRNGFLIDAGPGYIAPQTAAAAAEVVSVETFTAQRRQREEDILDAAARGDPALLYALLRWALRLSDAPSHADLIEWMEEGRGRPDTSSRYSSIPGTLDPPPPTEVLTPAKRQRVPSAARDAALERGRATQRAKRETAAAAGVAAVQGDGGD